MKKTKNRPFYISSTIRIEKDLFDAVREFIFKSKNIDTLTQFYHEAVREYLERNGGVNEKGC